MNSVKVLDCTLRDGGYLVDAQFGDITIKGIINGLVMANIDVVECGFLKDEPHQEGSTIFMHASEAKEYLPADRKKSSFVLLADFSRYTIDHLESNDGTSIDGVRACFFKHERFKAMRFCEKIIQKGYQCYVQPVDILGYSDTELLELIGMVNEFEPFAFSIVDTFGSLFQEDLTRVFHLVHHNLAARTRIGFHSHNNLQMSFSLSQHFIRLSNASQRDVAIDATLHGMGRGAGNTNTELLIHYLNKTRSAGYDYGIVLDAIENYIEPILAQQFWGYSMPYLLAGIHSAHVNNIAYLRERPALSRKDMDIILNMIDPEQRKRYDYALLEQLYMEHANAMIGTQTGMEALKEALTQQDILLLLPGKTLLAQQEDVLQYIEQRRPVVIGVNMLPPESYAADYVYFSSKIRKSYWENDARYAGVKKIITSNVTKESAEDTIIVDFVSLLKTGWATLDNSGVLLLRLLDKLDPRSIAIAGFDGYSSEQNENYMQKDLKKASMTINAERLNQEIGGMLKDYAHTRSSKASVFFLTQSRFEGTL